ncbi:hypothetical protein MUK42_36009 [Musa troglodytarum]|uniref:Uncharacterized protein n=1 Tax=Musa troglodytarum TaxID=320322 RepID=A0A9E7JRC4_9LILI|nr:hypothetical protein MUK42_36009 [Musa troglodytarum]
MPLAPAPSSCMLVFPTRIAPHDRSCLTQLASSIHGLTLCSHLVPPETTHHPSHRNTISYRGSKKPRNDRCKIHLQQQ